MPNPTLDIETQKARAEQFRALHDERPLVLANAWDAGSAHLIARVGAKAITTSSGAQSWAQGIADGNNLPFDDVLANIRRIAAAVDLPVSADIESGYGADPAAIANTITAVLEAGVVGVNLEDSGSPNSDTAPLYTAEEQAARIGAARGAADNYDVPLFINARTDVFLFAVGEESGRLEDVISRARGYREAGADGIFVPGLLDLDALKTLSEAVDLNVNAMWLPGAPSIDDLAAAGVNRFSVGTALCQAAYTHAQNSAKALLENGDYVALEESIDYFTFNAEFTD